MDNTYKDKASDLNSSEEVREDSSEKENDTAAEAEEENKKEETAGEEAEDAMTEAAEDEFAADRNTEDADDLPDDTEVPEDPEEDGSAAQEGDGKEEKKGNLFGRRDKKALAKKDEEIAALKDRYMRTLAEYENYRKRTEKEKADLYSYAVKDVMSKILPVLDNLERGLAALPEDSRDDPVAEGMDKICKQFVKALDDIGVKPIPAQGETFDPNLHNAVMHVDDEKLGENIVAEEFQKGYTYRDTVVRHSMVKVAN